MMVIVIFLYVIVIVFDFLPSKNWAVKEGVVYCVLLSISFCVLILYSLNITVPGPTGPIRDAVEKLLTVSRGLF